MKDRLKFTFFWFLLAMAVGLSSCKENLRRKPKAEIKKGGRGTRAAVVGRLNVHGKERFSVIFGMQDWPWPWSMSRWAMATFCTPMFKSLRANFSERHQAPPQ